LVEVTIEANLMDRFLWLTTGLEFNETKLCTQPGVKIYDGEEKVSFYWIYYTCLKTHLTENIFLFTLPLKHNVFWLMKWRMVIF